MFSTQCVDKAMWINLPVFICLCKWFCVCVYMLHMCTGMRGAGGLLLHQPMNQVSIWDDDGDDNGQSEGGQARIYGKPWITPQNLGGSLFLSPHTHINKHKHTHTHVPNNLAGGKFQFPGTPPFLDKVLTVLKVVPWQGGTLTPRKATWGRITFHSRNR